EHEAGRGSGRDHMSRDVTSGGSLAQDHRELTAKSLLRKRARRQPATPPPTALGNVIIKMPRKIAASLSNPGKIAVHIIPPRTGGIRPSNSPAKTSFLVVLSPKIGSQRAMQPTGRY